jgi:hypothetical protein
VRIAARNALIWFQLGSPWDATPTGHTPVMACLDFKVAIESETKATSSPIENENAFFDV